MTSTKASKKKANAYYRYEPPDISLAAIKRFAKKIAEKFDPDTIVLFGSFAYGKPHRWSDVDILVVMPCRNEIDQSIRIGLAFEPYFPLDLIVRKPKTLKWRLEEGDSFLREVMGQGKVLYE